MEREKNEAKERIIMLKMRMISKERQPVTGEKNKA